ncbi:MAG: hypothetical protein NTY15_15590 [Planctomycetota bacterium]|nr:hypothetical protein [Planctomycetota bacterium]
MSQFLHRWYASSSCRRLICMISIGVFGHLLVGSAKAQVVQIPTVGTFSLQTSVVVPDSGSAYLGGSQRGAVGSNSLGPGSIARGATQTSAGASVHATIIDLNELDLMIRSQAGSKPTVPDLVSIRSKPPQYSLKQNGTNIKNAEYEYLAALSHSENTAPDRVSSDSSYYLSLANDARQQRHWAAVELYYKLAWESLPVARRQSVLKTLMEARSKPEVDSKNEKPKSSAK